MRAHHDDILATGPDALRSDRRPAAPRTDPAAAGIIALQRTAGNAAVVALLNQQRDRAVDGIDAERPHADSFPVQRAIEVTNETETRKRTGEYNRSFQWQCTDEHRDGYIVQHIYRTETVNGQESAVNQYWEAWRVENHQVLGPAGQALGAAMHDSWTNPAGRQSRGTLEMTGSVYWLPRDSPLIGQFRAGAVAQAGELLSTTDLDIGGAPLWSHNIRFAWDGTTGMAALEMIRDWYDPTAEPDERDTQEDTREMLRDMGFDEDTIATALQQAVNMGIQFADDAEE